MLWLLAVFAGFGGNACGSSNREPSLPDRSRASQRTGEAAAIEPKRAVELEWETVAEYPHDGCAFTQGLLWTADTLFESTGRYGQSSVRRVELETGRILVQTDLSSSLFGEGLAKVDEHLLQLTWHAGEALIWNSGDLTYVGEHEYRGEGWGLTYDPASARLVMSNGSDQLMFRQPSTFDLETTLDVTFDGRPLGNLNELEWAEGRIWANVLSDDRLFRIDPTTGEVDAYADLSALRDRFAPQAAADLDPLCRPDVLNGVAYRGDRDTYLVTGKYWPRLFEIRWREADSVTTN